MGDGEVSPWLAREARAGDQLEIRGPGGRSFSWHVDDGGPLLLVAGGSGLVPLRAMLRHRLAVGAELDTRLVLSVRTEEDQLYAAEIEAWRAAGVQTTVTFTRAGGRRVDAAMLAEAGPPPEARPHVFVCGPTAFVEAAATHLLRAGHATDLVRTERFGGAV
jgi:ferredoxin-NADP reductase